MQVLCLALAEFYFITCACLLSRNVEAHELGLSAYGIVFFCAQFVNSFLCSIAPRSVSCHFRHTLHHFNISAFVTVHVVYFGCKSGLAGS